MNAQPDQDLEFRKITTANRDHVAVQPPPSVVRRALGRLKNIPPRWIAAGVALLIAAVALLWAIPPSAPASKVAPLSRESIPVVTAMSPRLSDVTSSVTFTGTIYARYDMPIGVEGEGGRITAINVEAGDHVKRGQLLAKLDQSVLVPQLNRLAASLEEAHAQAALSLAEYGRAKGVEAAGALSAEEIERRRAAAVTDEARVKVVAAQLAEMQARLDRTEIRAPADGVVLTRTAEVGQTASPSSEPLFRLARGGDVEMRGQIAEQDVIRIQIDQPAFVYLTGITEPFRGKVRLLGAVIDPKTRLGEIRIALDPDSALRPGAFARGRVTVGTARRPVLPQTAVLSDVKGAYVFIVNDSSQIERRAVRIGDTGPSGVVIVEGLDGNERVITTAGGFLRAGERVSVAALKESQ